MREKTFGPFVQRTSWGFAVAVVLIAFPVPIRAFANEPSPPTEGQSQTAQDRCKFLMEKAAEELRGIGEALEGRSWVQRKKLKEITARIEAISEELERSWQESKPSVNESRGATQSDIGMTGRRVPFEIILHRVVHRRKDTVLSDPVQQPGTPEHLPHRILQLGKQDLGVGFFRLGHQA